MEELRIIFIAAAAMLLAAVTGARAGSPIEVGKPFPGMAFPSLENGEPMSVRSFSGQKLVLHVFASW